MSIAALTKDELIAALQQEVRILVHLAKKVEPSQVDYRPTPKQRSIIELLRYMAIMGPELVKGIKAGKFDGAAWGAAQEKLSTADLKTVLPILEQQGQQYADLLGAFTEEDFRGQIDLFGAGGASRGSLISHMVVSGHAAYRTQLFLYLKSLGREELNTYNLWMGMDAPAPAAAT